MTLPHVSFYLLNQSVPDGKLRTACRVTSKAFGRGHTIRVQATDQTQAVRLDELLWTFEQGSFVPHRLESSDTDPAPVTIGCGEPEADPADVLVALGRDIPDQFHAYRRIVDIVDASDEDRQLARQRYKTYRERGCTLETHHISP